MTNRREFLQATALAAAVPIVARSGIAADAGSEGLVVFDRRFPPARRFADRAGLEGLELRGIDGDITRLWFEELSLRWKDESIPVTGLTARPALFCLERLAWDHGMRVVSHIQHIGQPNGEVVHSVRIPVGTIGSRELAAAGDLWPEFMADALTRAPVKDRKPRGPSEASMPAAFDNDESVLHSWVIAPVLPAMRATARASKTTRGLSR